MINDLPLRQLDQALASWRSLPRSRPPGGWLHAIRQALGMTTRQLARNAGVSQPSVVDAEKAEGRGDITLTTLRRYAEALDCELVYALVPRQPLEQAVQQRADRIAREQVSRVGHSMALEDQATETSVREQQVLDLRRRLLDGPRSRLWK